MTGMWPGFQPRVVLFGTARYAGVMEERKRMGTDGLSALPEKRQRGQGKGVTCDGLASHPAGGDGNTPSRFMYRCWR